MNHARLVRSWVALALTVAAACGVVAGSQGVARAETAPTGQPTIYLPLLVNAGTATTPPATNNNPVRTGQATYYDATGAGNCSFEASPSNLMVAAMNQVDYNNAALCGGYVQVTGPKGAVVVRITDRCPECPAGNIDLSPQAFAKIADLVQGRVSITWQIVSPAIGGPIVYRFKEGSSQYWTAVQVRNIRNPIAKFEYRTASGAWQTVPRVEYNYFVQNSGMGVGPYTFRVTDMYGHVLTDSGVALKVGSTVAGAAQFPAP